MRKVFAVLMVILLLGCDQASKPLFLEGSTMGTTYHITLLKVPQQIKKDQLKQEVDKLLAEVNQQMSTYKKDSELSLLNQNPSTDWIPISKALLTVIQEALRISFGPKWQEDKMPTQEEINQLKQKVNYQYLSIQLDPPAIKKTKPDVYVDLSGIAKGFGVDVIANFIEKQGILNYLIEIGGELRTKGSNPQGEAWKVAVEKPIPNIRTVQTVVPVHDAGIATSGDYRNFFELNGRRFSHIIDPKTGEPVQTNVVSATILDSKSCMTADAWAKVPIVMGAEKALALADRENSSRAFQTWR